MVTLSFWLPYYMEYACKAWFYWKKYITIFLGAHLKLGIPLEFRYMFGAFTKDMHQNSSIKLTFVSGYIGIFV